MSRFELALFVQQLTYFLGSCWITSQFTVLKSKTDEGLWGPCWALDGEQQANTPRLIGLIRLKNLLTQDWGVIQDVQQKHRRKRCFLRVTWILSEVFFSFCCGGLVYLLCSPSLFTKKQGWFLGIGSIWPKKEFGFQIPYDLNRIHGTVDLYTTQRSQIKWGLTWRSRTKKKVLPPMPPTSLSVFMNRKYCINLHQTDFWCHTIIWGLKLVYVGVNG